jgi:hypothetical protein
MAGGRTACIRQVRAIRWYWLVFFWFDAKGDEATGKFNN